MEIQTIITSEPLIAYRVWRLHDSGSICSLNGEVWESRKALVAKCQCNYEHSCGIYSTKTIERLRESNYLTAKIPIFGEVWIWGKMTVHEYGYRSEFAYPKNFYLQALSQKMREVEQRVQALTIYGVSIFAVRNGHEPIPLWSPEHKFIPEGVEQFLEDKQQLLIHKRLEPPKLAVGDKVYVGADIAIVLNVSNLEEPAFSDIVLSVSKRYCLKGRMKDIVWDRKACIWRAEQKNFVRRS